MKFKNMFSPIQIGPMTVKNRFVVPPMGNNFANSDGTWSDQSVAYYSERAKGQFGLITIEATVVHKGDVYKRQTIRFAAFFKRIRNQ